VRAGIAGRSGRERGALVPDLGRKVGVLVRERGCVDALAEEGRGGTGRGRVSGDGTGSRTTFAIEKLGRCGRAGLGGEELRRTSSLVGEICEVSVCVEPVSDILRKERL